MLNLYEQIAAVAKKEHIKTIFLDIAREENVHVGKFQLLLLKEELRNK